jgi:hypothetical protein
VFSTRKFQVFIKSIVQNDKTQEVHSIILLLFLSLHGERAPSRPRPPHYRGSAVTLSYTHHTRQDSSRRVIGPSQRLLPDNTQYSKETSMSPSGIRTRVPSERASGGRPTPQTARPPGSTSSPIKYINFMLCGTWVSGHNCRLQKRRVQPGLRHTIHRWPWKPLSTLPNAATSDILWVM